MNDHAGQILVSCPILRRNNDKRGYSGLQTSIHCSPLYCTALEQYVGGVPLCAPASDLTVHNPPVWASEMRFNWEERQRDVSASWEDMRSCEEGGLSWTEITVHYSNKESPCAAKASGSTCPLAENTQSYRARVHSLIYNQLFIGDTFCSFVAFNFSFLTTLELLLYDPFPPSLWPIERTGSSCYCTFKTSKYMSDLCKHIVMSSPLTTH